MVILTNCLRDIVDEGGLKVASSLIKRIKKEKTETLVVSYDKKSELSDIHFKINKLMLSPQLICLLRQRKETLLYVPAPAKMISLAIRVFILSIFARVKVILIMKFPLGKISSFLLKASRAEIITLSRKSQEYYQEKLGIQVRQLKAAVDLEQFQPVSQEEKARLRKIYEIPEDKKIVLHVGHLNEGRNVGNLLKLDEKYHVILVLSTLTADEQDKELRAELASKENITIINSYIPHIEHVYQISDVYLFPVVEAGRCIDVPLSVMEAAACNIPVVTTAYGELQEMLDKEGFYQIDSFDERRLNELIEIALLEKKKPRKGVLGYDWDLAVKDILQEIR